MATKQDLARVDFSDVHWFQVFDPKTGEYASDENTRGSESFDNPMQDLVPAADVKREKDGSIKPLPGKGQVINLTRGWQSSGGVMEVYALDSDGKKAAVAQRKRQIALWEAAGGVYKDVAQTAKRVWGFVSAKTGKAVKNPPAPSYGGNMGFRRAYAIMGAIHLLNYSRPNSPEYSYSVPIEVREYEGELERLTRHAWENEYKDAGASKYSQTDYVLIARKAIGALGTEADLTRCLKSRGTAQKCYAFAKLDSKFPTLKLVERVLADPPKLDGKQKRYPYGKGCYIPFSTLDKEDLRRLLKGGKKEGIEYQPAEKPDEVESYVRAAMEGKKNDNAKMLPKANIKAGGDSHDCMIVRRVLSAVYNNEQKVFDKLRELAPAINEALTKAKIELPK